MRLLDTIVNLRVDFWGIGIALQGFQFFSKNFDIFDNFDFVYFLIKRNIFREITQPFSPLIPITHLHPCF